MKTFRILTATLLLFGMVGCAANDPLAETFYTTDLLPGDKGGSIGKGSPTAVNIKRMGQEPFGTAKALSVKDTRARFLDSK